MDRLKMLRKKIGKTQLQMAKYLGISQQAYATYESDKAQPPQDVLIKLADYFNVTTDYLLNRSNNVSDTNKPAELEDVYFNLAKEAQEKGIHPDDVKKIIAMYEVFKQNDK